MSIITRALQAVFEPLQALDQRIKPYRRKINDSRVGDATTKVTSWTAKRAKRTQERVRRVRK